ncbi:MAG: glycosyltransferase family 39 protein, partial [Candidatus Omnitrophica bacterium]|nr:glycosyltransferase family 39 protein [Candidatus Omnitrophota bacterium]
MDRIIFPKPAWPLQALILLLGVSTFLAGLLLCFIPGMNAVRWFFAHTSFYLLSILFLLWLRAIISSISKIRPSTNTIFTTILLSGTALALTISIFIINPPAFRLHNDETALLGTSQSLAREQTVFIPWEAVLCSSKLIIIHTALPKRPLLFPFLTSLLHELKGYVPDNAFILNFFILFTLLALIGNFFTYHWGKAAGFAIQCAVVSHPILWHTSASGISDLLNILFFFLSTLALWRHIRAPSAESLTLLVLTLCLCAHSRYESILFIPVTLVFLVAWRKISRKNIRESLPSLIIAAICCLPLFWQR